MIKDVQAHNYHLETFYKQNYSKKVITQLLITTTDTLIQLYFTDKIVSNETYEKDIFKIIKKLIIKNLPTNTQDGEFNILLSVYIFKLHFKNVFTYLSEYLMQEVAYSNIGIINFLKYYSLDTILIDKMKYKVPQIKEDNGPRWNVTSMLSILKTYIKTQNQLKTIQESIESINLNIASYYIEGLSPLEHNEIIEKKYETLEHEINKNASHITIIHDSLSILSKADDINKANKELDIAQENRMHLRDKKSQLTKSKVKQVKMLEYHNLLKQLDILERGSKPKEKIIEQNYDSYLSIKNALIKALISKKQAL